MKESLVDQLTGDQLIYSFHTQISGTIRQCKVHKKEARGSLS